MNLKRADYFTIVGIGTLEDFYKKMEMEGDSIEDVVNTVNESGESLLGEALGSCNLKVARLLLNAGAKVNVVSKENYNELHFIAAHLSDPEAVVLAKELVEKGVDLNQKDKRDHNTAFWHLCFYAMMFRRPDVYELIELCMKKNPDIHCKNTSGKSVGSFILEQNAETLKKIVLEGKEWR